MKAGEINVQLTLENEKFNVSVRQAGDLLRQLEKQLGTTASGAKKTEDSVGRLGHKFRDFMLVAASVRFALMDIDDVFLSFPKRVVSASAEFERMTKLMEGLSKETDQLKRKQEALSNVKFNIEMAKNAPFEIKAINDAFVKLKTGGIDPTNGSLKSLLDGVAHFGGNSDSLHRAAIAIQQMSGKGVVSMEELRQQLGEAIPDAMQLMAEGMGVTMQELSKSVSKGTVEATPAISKMLTMMSVAHRNSASEMMKTWSGAMERLKTEWNVFLVDIGNEGAFDGLKGHLNELIEWFQTDDARKFAKDLGDGLASAVEAFVSFAKFVVEWGDEIAAVFIGIGAIQASKMIAPFNASSSALASAWRTATAEARIGAQGVAEAEKRKLAAIQETVTGAKTALAEHEAVATKNHQQEAKRFAESAERGRKMLADIKAREAEKIAALEASLVAKAELEQRAIELEEKAMAIREGKGSMRKGWQKTAGAYGRTLESQAVSATQDAAAQAQKAGAISQEVALLEKQAAAVTKTVVANEALARSELALAQARDAGTARLRQSVAANEAAVSRQASVVANSIKDIGKLSVVERIGSSAGIAMRGAASAAAGFAKSMALASLQLGAIMLAAEAAIWVVGKLIDKLGEAEKRKKALDDARESLADGNRVSGESRAVLEQTSTYWNAQVRDLQRRKAEGYRVGAINGQDMSIDDALTRAQKNADHFADLLKKDTELLAKEEANKNVRRRLRTLDADLARIEDAAQANRAKIIADNSLSEAQKNVKSREQMVRSLADSVAKLKTENSAAAAALAASNTTENREYQKSVEDRLKQAIERKNLFEKDGILTSKKGVNVNSKAAARDPLEEAIVAEEAKIVDLKMRLADIQRGAKEYASEREKVYSDAFKNLLNGKYDKPEVIDGKNVMQAVGGNGAGSYKDAVEARRKDMLEQLQAGKSLVSILNEFQAKIGNASEKSAFGRLLEDLNNTAAINTAIGSAQALARSEDYIAKLRAESSATVEGGEIKWLSDVTKLYDDLAKSIGAAGEDMEKLNKQRREAIGLAAGNSISSRTADADDKLASANLKASKGNGYESRHGYNADIGAERDRQIAELDKMFDKEAGELTKNGFGAGSSEYKALEALYAKKKKTVELEADLKFKKHPFEELLKDWGNAVDKMEKLSAKMADDFADNITDSLTGTTVHWRQTLANWGKEFTNIMVKKSMSQMADMMGGGKTGDAAGGLGGLGGAFGSVFGNSGDKKEGGAPAISSVVDSVTKSLGEMNSSIGKFIGDSMSGLMESFQMFGSWLSSLFTQGAASSVTQVVGGAFANGGIMTEFGPAQLRAYANGGIADRPQVALYGEGSKPEAYVPLPDGRTIPVTMAGGGQSSVASVSVIVNNTTGDGETKVEANNSAASNAWANIAKNVKSMVQAELVTQMRTGGILAKGK